MDLGPRRVIASYPFLRRQPHRLLVVELVLVLLVLLLTEMMEVLKIPWGRNGWVPDAVVGLRLRGGSGESIGKGSPRVGLRMVLEPLIGKLISLCRKVRDGVWGVWRGLRVVG